MVCYEELTTIWPFKWIIGSPGLPLARSRLDHIVEAQTTGCQGKLNVWNKPNGGSSNISNLYCFTFSLSGPRGLGHILTRILCVLYRTNVGSIPLATVGASRRLPSDICLTAGILWSIVSYVHSSCIKLKLNLL